MSVSTRRNLKLSPRYYGPFQVVHKIGNVAYKLDLPPASRIFPIFHVSSLKKTLGNQIRPNPQLPEVTTEGTLAPAPDRVLQRRLKKKKNRAGVEVLIKWQGATEEEATWEDMEDLHRRFPDLAGKVFWEGGRVMRKGVWLSEGSVWSMPCLKRKFREGERVK